MITVRSVPLIYGPGVRKSNCSFLSTSYIMDVKQPDLIFYHPFINGLTGCLPLPSKMIHMTAPMVKVWLGLGTKPGRLVLQNDCGHYLKRSTLT